VLNRDIFKTAVPSRTTDNYYFDSCQAKRNFGKI